MLFLFFVFVFFFSVLFCFINIIIIINLVTNVMIHFHSLQFIYQSDVYCTLDLNALIQMCNIVISNAVL